MSFLQPSPQVKAFAFGVSISLLILIAFFAGGLADRVFVIKPLDFLAKRAGVNAPSTSSDSTASPLSDLLKQSSSLEDIVDVSSRAVVTVSIKKQQRVIDSYGDLFGLRVPVPGSQRIEQIKQDIGTGFIIDGGGLIVTNKHVVSDDQAQYTVIDKDDKEYPVTNIYRDPTNDLAIIKVEGSNLPALPMGDSDKIRPGQEVIAIGTALGEFRHTVTKGVVSGLGRGIQATDGFGFESLEGVIQTDAAINPGNSGGPLLDTKGSVIGVNVAVSAAAENIGFAIPINVVKASLDNFNKTGQFERPFMGVRYQVITKKAALANEVAEGAYVLEVIAGSSAADAGLQTGDIITSFDGKAVNETSQELATMINNKKIGDRVEIEYWRNGERAKMTVTLKANSNR
jgi:serine protease Do